MRTFSITLIGPGGASIPTTRVFAATSSTFVLIPSLDRELCVAETVRRQLPRPFARSRAAEEATIRRRFPLYVGLPARKFETMKSPCVVADEICKVIPGERILPTVERIGAVPRSYQ